MGRPIANTQRTDKDRAHALVVKGKLDEAILIYRSLVKQCARDASLRLHLAETCRKRGLIDDSVRAYRESAELYAADGHTARARAALLCALQLAPGEPQLVNALRALRPAEVVRHLALVPPVPPSPPVSTSARPRAASAEPERWRVKPPPPVPDVEEISDSDVVEVGDEAEECVTEPFLPIFQWLEATPDQAPPPPVPRYPIQEIPKITVPARPRRVAAKAAGRR